MDRTNKTRAVFVINNLFIGGVERLMLDILSRLDRNKIEVELFTVLGSGPLEKEFRRLEIPVHIAGPRIGMERGLFIKIFWVFLSPFIIIKLSRLLRKNRPDVVVTSLFQADIIGALSAKLAGVKRRIFIQHDTERLSFPRRILKRLLVVRWATQAVAVSETVKTFLLETFHMPAGRIKVIKNGTDLSFFSSSRRALAEEPVIGMIGRLEKVKGPDVLLRAANILKHKHRIEPEIILSGTGSADHRLLRYKKVHKLNHIRFIEKPSRPTEILSQIDILVVPSRSEGFGLVALEGLVAHKAIVASDLPALKELVGNGREGIIFPVGDILALANVLNELITNRETLNKIRANVEEWARGSGREFDIEKKARQYQDLLLPPPD